MGAVSASFRHRYLALGITSPNSEIEFSDQSQPSELEQSLEDVGFQIVLLSCSFDWMHFWWWVRLGLRCLVLYFTSYPRFVQVHSS